MPYIIAPPYPKPSNEFSVMPELGDFMFTFLDNSSVKLSGNSLRIRRIELH
jgi:hypothetical protein